MTALPAQARCHWRHGTIGMSFPHSSTAFPSKLTIHTGQVDAGQKAFAALSSQLCQLHLHNDSPTATCPYRWFSTHQKSIKSCHLCSSHHSVVELPTPVRVSTTESVIAASGRKMHCHQAPYTTKTATASTGPPYQGRSRAPSPTPHPHISHTHTAAPDRQNMHCCHHLPVVDLSVLVQISALKDEADIPLRQVQAALLVQALHGVEELAKVNRLIPICVCTACRSVSRHASSNRDNRGSGTCSACKQRIRFANSMVLKRCQRCPAWFPVSACRADMHPGATIL